MQPTYRYVEDSQKSNTNGSKRVTILHFNDIYDALPHYSADSMAKGELLGGASRFATLLKRYDHLNPIRTFGGDWLAPSLMSSLTRGMHMAEILEAMRIHFGTYGNHDFDFGLEWLQKITHDEILFNNKKRSQTCWIASNLLNPLNGEPICDAEKYVIFEWGNIKIGLIGISENWIASTVPGEEEIGYTNYCDSADNLAKQLKLQHNVDIVISISHNRKKSDEIFGEKVKSVDLNLGGHSHSCTNGYAAHRFIKSGQCFEFLSVITITIVEGKLDVQVEQVKCEQHITPDPFVELEEAKSETIGYTKNPIMCIKKQLRLVENSFANFITDLFKEAMKADIGFISGGCIGSDAELPVGNVTKGHLLSWFPWGGTICSKRVKGSDLIASCENGLFFLPLAYGQFCHFSGMKCSYRPLNEPGNRVSGLIVNGSPIELERYYTVATNDYIALGGDGYKQIANSEWETKIEMGREIVGYLLDWFDSHKELNLILEGRLIVED